MNVGKVIQIFGFHILALAAGLVLAQPSSAACINGVPCVTPKTVNDPLNANDGPNITGENKAKSENPSCDADFMNQIYAKSFAEAQRENIINQVLVRKPDSILEYTCFDMLAGQAAAHAGPLFSESTEWSNISVSTGTTIDSRDYPTVILSVNMGPDRLDNSLRNLVSGALNTYIQRNFSHSFLGGVLGINSDIVDNIRTGGYSCQFMNNVFFMAKCGNANTDVTFDPLSWYASNDPRQRPENTACTAGTGISQGILDVATNKNFAYVNFDVVNPTYLDRQGGGACGAPIPTGVASVKAEKTVDRPIGNVTLGLTTIYQNKICSNPGCYYDPSSDSCRR
jgi:hypothetical protein